MTNPEISLTPNQQSCQTAANLSDPNNPLNFTRPIPATEEQQRLNSLHLQSKLLIRFPEIARSYTKVPVNANHSEWLRQLNNCSEQDANAEIIRRTLDVLEHLNGQLVSKDEELARQNKELEQLRQNVSSLTHPATLVTSNPYSQRRISTDPPRFTGETKDAVKRQQEYIAWKCSVEIVFARDAAIFKTDFDRILHVSSLLGGEAAALLNDDFGVIAQNPMDTNAWQWKTAQELWDFLDKQYQTVDLVQDASRKFDDCIQGQRNFSNFINQFRTLGQKSKKTKEQMVEALKKKVNDDIGKLLVSILPSQKPAPDDFEGWVAICQNFESNLDEMKHREKWNAIVRFNNNHQTQHQNQRQPTTTEGGDAMDLSRIQTTTGQQRPKGISWEERQRRRSLNLCMYCGEGGHVKTTCPRTPSSRAHNQPPQFNTGQNFRNQPYFPAPASHNPPSSYAPSSNATPPPSTRSTYSNQPNHHPTNPAYSRPQGSQIRQIQTRSISDGEEQENTDSGMPLFEYDNPQFIAPNHQGKE